MAYLKLLPVRLYFVRIRLTDVCHGSHNKIKKISVATPCVRSSRTEAANARRADSRMYKSNNKVHVHYKAKERSGYKCPDHKQERWKLVGFLALLDGCTFKRCRAS